MNNCVVHSAFLQKGIAEVDVDIHVVGADLQRFLEMSDRLLRFSFLQKSVAEAVFSLVVVL